MGIWEDFKLKYAPPKVENITVGFSGIDPAGYAATLTAEQLDMVRNLVLAYISKLTIRIDSGNLDPQADEPEVPSIPLKPSEIPHERLDELLGGNSEGHYHLTEDEIVKLQAYPEREDLNAAIEHEKLPDLQGGSEGKHYHLTDTELAQLKAIIDKFILDEDTEVVIPTSSHEMLNELMGGTIGQHYHFTLDEWNKLKKVIDALFPDGATEPKFPSVPATTDEPSGPS